MKSQFRHVALIGKYPAAVSGALSGSVRSALEDIAHFLNAKGCEVAFERETAATAGITGYTTLEVAAIGEQCDLVLVVGGDGTMLGIGRQLARHGVPAFIKIDVEGAERPALAGMASLLQRGSPAGRSPSHVGSPRSFGCPSTALPVSCGRSAAHRGASSPQPQARASGSSAPR